MRFKFTLASPRVIVIDVGAVSFATVGDAKRMLGRITRGQSIIRKQKQTVLAGVASHKVQGIYNLISARLTTVNRVFAFC